VVYLQDVPVAVRYKLERPSFAAATAADLARGTAERFASWRAQANVIVDWANESWLSAWGVEAAAVAAYHVHAVPEAREDLFVVVRQGLVMLITWTYPKEFVDDPAYATFASVAEATMTWDPARWEQRGRVWPESVFVGPGLHCSPRTPRGKYDELTRGLAGSPFLPEERAALLALLSGIVSSAGAPWVTLTAEARDNHKASIAGVSRNTRLHALLDEAFAEVRTAHDVRGLAVLIGRAIDVRPRSFTPAPTSIPLPAAYQGAPPVIRHL
jgi:hypothetical protein